MPRVASVEDHTVEK